MIAPIIAIFAFVVFLLTKIGHITVHSSDTNGYVLAAKQILDGKLLYKDIFLTNAPLFPYISAVYTFFIGGNISLFYLTPLIEIGGICFFLYKILFETTKSKKWAAGGVIMYLNTFIVMASSHHQTGIFTATLLASAGYYFAQRNKFILSGILLAMMVMVKGYFLPVAAAITLYYGFRNYKHGFQIIVAATIAVVVILLPTLLLARDAFIQQIFGYTLQRSAGLDKGVVLSFFFKSHWLLLLAFISSLAFWKKNTLNLLIVSFGVAFLIIFKDIYFFYINLLVPFLILGTIIGIRQLTTKYPNEFVKLILIAFFAVHILLTWQLYYSKYHVSGEITDYEKIVKAIKKANPEVIYGEADIAPAFSYSTGAPLLNDVIDTNLNLYRSGVYNETEMSKDFFSKKGIFIGYGAKYPALNFDQELASEIIQQNQVKEKCTLLVSHPIVNESVANRLQIFKCYN